MRLLVKFETVITLSVNLKQNNENFPKIPILNSEPCKMVIIFTLLMSFISGMKNIAERPEIKA